MNKSKKLPVNQIICGDSIEVLSIFPEESIDMVMFSPPYWGLRDYGVKGQFGVESHPNKYIERLVGLCKQIKRVLKKSGSMYIVVGDSYFGTGDGVPQTIAGGNLRDLPKKSIKKSKFISNWLRGKQRLLIPDRLFINLQNNGWILRNKIIWTKTNPMPESVRDRYTTSYEEIGFFVKSNKYYFNMEAVLKAFKKSTKERAKRGFSGKYKQTNAGEYRMTHRGNISFKETVRVKSGRHPRDVWKIATKSYHGAHFAVFPEELCIDPIKASCPLDGVVLDPMCGSGTTCVVAHKLGRRWIGIDLNKDYCEIARKRLESIGAYSNKIGDYI